MPEITIGKIVVREGYGIDVDVAVLMKPHSLSASIRLEEKDYSLAEIKRLAEAKFYELLKDALHESKGE
jgi:hypothetical protein